MAPLNPGDRAIIREIAFEVAEVVITRSAPAFRELAAGVAEKACDEHEATCPIGRQVRRWKWLVIGVGLGAGGAGGWTLARVLLAI